MRQLLFLLALSIICTINTNGQTVEKWVFQGILIGDNVKGCVNPAYTNHDNYWVKNDKDYKTKNGAAEEKFRTKYEGRLFRLALPIYATEGDPKLISLVAFKMQCGPITHKFISGKTMEEIKNTCINFVKDEDNRWESYNIVSTVNTDEEIAKEKNK